MNKKGSVSLTLIVILIAVVAIVAAFAFPKFRFFLLGMIFMGAGIMIAVKGDLNKTKSIFALMFIAIGILVMFLNGFLTQTVFGSSTLGLDSVDYFSSSSSCFNTPVSGGLWLYTIRGGGLSQYAYGSYSPSLVDNLNEGSEKTTKTFSIDTFYDQYCEYPLVVNPSATPVYTLSDMYSWNSPLLGDLAAKCVAEAATKSECTGTDGYFAGKVGGQLKCYCTKYTKRAGAIGSAPNFNSPSTSTDITITVDNGGTKSTQTFSTNSASVQGKVGDNVCAVWQGNLVTGSTCGLPSSDVLPAYVGGNWKLLSKDRYDTYKADFTTLLSQFNAQGNEEGIKATIADLNTKANNYLNNPISFGVIENPSSQTTAKITKKLTTLIQYPVLSMYVKASWIGVVTPIPKPDITSAISSCFGAGEAGVIKVTVKNIGTERGAINLYGTCPAGFNVQRQDITLDPGASTIVNMPLTGTTDQLELKGTCTITAETIENKDTATVGVCVTGHPVCDLTDPDYCEGNRVWECANVMAPSIKDDCVARNLNCVYDKDGVAYCSSGEEKVVCGNGLCEKGETKLNCPKDCDDEENIPCEDRTPKFMGWEEVQTEKQTVWSVIGIAKPRAETYCKATNAPYIFGGAIVIIFALAAFLIIVPKKKLKGKTTKFGKIGK